MTQDEVTSGLAVPEEEDRTLPGPDPGHSSHPSGPSLLFSLLPAHVITLENPVSVAVRLLSDMLREKGLGSGDLSSSSDSATSWLCDFGRGTHSGLFNIRKFRELDFQDLFVLTEA